MTYRVFSGRKNRTSALARTADLAGDKCAHGRARPPPGHRVYALSSERWFDLFVLPGDSASSRSS
jgi:hypothetical protein